MKSFFEELAELFEPPKNTIPVFNDTMKEFNADTQKAQVLQHLKKYGVITKMEGVHLYHIIDTATIIKLLRREGYNITTEMVTKTNSKGKTVRYAKYHLKS